MNHPQLEVMTMIYLGTVALRAIVALVFLAAGVEKLAQPTRLATLLASRPGTRALGSRSTVAFLGALEVLLAALLVIPGVWRVGALGAAVVLLAFTVVVGYWRMRDQSGDCGCGRMFDASGISWHHTGLLAAFSALAGALALQRMPIRDGLTESLAVVFLVTLGLLAALVRSQRGVSGPRGEPSAATNRGT